MLTTRTPCRQRSLLRSAAVACAGLVAFAALPSIAVSEARGARTETTNLRNLEWVDSRAFAKAATGRTELNLDRDLTRNVERLLQKARPVAGAAVVIEVATGRVLALAEVGADTGESLLLSPLAPAASVFKLFTTATLFERSDVTPRSRVCTKGGIRAIGAEHLSPPTGTGVHCAPFAEALGTSRNAAFAQLATQKLKPQDLREIAELLGMNHPLLLDVPGSFGTLEVPSEPLHFARTATGFENSRLSVFGAAQLGLTIASGGYARVMHLGVERAKPLAVSSVAPGPSAPLAVVSQETTLSPSAATPFAAGALAATPLDASTTPSSTTPPSIAAPAVVELSATTDAEPTHNLAAPPQETRVLSSSTIRRLVRAMETTVEYGTAREAFLDEKSHAYLGPVKVAGKTGTLKQEGSGPTASWFVGFAPSQKPKVVVSVLLLNSDLWYQKGNTVARDVLRAYFASEGTSGVTAPF